MLIINNDEHMYCTSLINIIFSKRTVSKILGIEFGMHNIERYLTDGLLVELKKEQVYEYYN